ncbi:MAG: low molecular weight phosphatase family protein [Pseudomonadota bacterium]
MAVRSILFACNMNSVRSPMAEVIARTLIGGEVAVDSCGVYEGVEDPFVGSVLKEKDFPPKEDGPKDFAEVELAEYDLVIALPEKAAGEARRLGAKVEYWDIPNPTDVRGPEAALMDAYRAARDLLIEKITERFVR